jgi:hypothetical protein
MVSKFTKLISILAMLAPALAFAVPTTLSFSARIADSGRPVTGSHAFVFKFWDCDGSDPATCVEGDNVVWSETQSLTVNEGIVNAVLGALTPFPGVLFNGGARWLEVTMDGASFGRMAVQSVPYALRAGTAANIPWGNVSGRPSLVIGSSGSMEPGFVTRFFSTSTSAGTVVARTDWTFLERDGTPGGMRTRTTAGGQSIACTGSTAANGTVNVNLVLNANVNYTIFSDAQGVVFARCMFGSFFSALHIAEVTMSRYPGDYYWGGLVWSTYNH